MSVETCGRLPPSLHRSDKFDFCGELCADVTPMENCKVLPRLATLYQSVPSNIMEILPFSQCFRYVDPRQYTHKDITSSIAQKSIIFYGTRKPSAQFSQNLLFSIMLGIYIAEMLGKWWLCPCPYA